MQAGSTNASRRVAALAALDRWFNPLLLFLAATSVPALIIQTGEMTAEDGRLVVAISWTIWGGFSFDFGARMLLALDRRKEFGRVGWDLIIVVGQPIYAWGDRKAGAGFAFILLLVLAGRGVVRGRLLRRTGHKFRTQPLRIVAFVVPWVWLTSAALIYRFESAEGTVSTYWDGLWWGAVTIATVGYGDISPKSTNGRIVGVVTMIVGIGMFSLITAKLAEILFLEGRRGRHREVLEHDHTLVLGWSPKVFTIISQLLIANASERDPSIVVLAERDTDAMLAEVRAHVPQLDRSNTTVVFRSGEPRNPNDIRLCRPELAHSVIVIDDTDEDASVVRALLALLEAAPDLDVPVVAEIDRPSTAEALRLAFGGRVVIVNPTSFIARTTAQACRSAGVSQAYEDLLQFEGSELYLLDDPAAIGHTARRLAHALHESCLVGILDGSGRVDLNVDPDRTIVEGDTLIVLAVDDSRIELQLNAQLPAPAMEEADRVLPAAPHGESPGKPEHLAVYGWNHLGELVVRELDAYTPAGSKLTIVADPAANAAANPADFDTSSLANLTVNVREAAGTEYADLVEVIAGEGANHALVLCQRRNISAAEADARALVTMMQVRRVLDQAGHDTTLVTELLDEQDVALASRAAAGEFIVSDKLVSLLLAQLAENPHLAPVFDDLLDPEGAELYCKPARRYCEPGVPTTFRSITTAAIALGETAIGFRQLAGGHDAVHGFGISVNPRKDTPVTLTDSDQVIVLAED